MALLLLTGLVHEVGRPVLEEHAVGGQPRRTDARAALGVLLDFDDAHIFAELLLALAAGVGPGHQILQAADEVVAVGLDDDAAVDHRERDHPVRQLGLDLGVELGLGRFEGEVRVAGAVAVGLDELLTDVALETPRIGEEAQLDDREQVNETTPDVGQVDVTEEQAEADVRDLFDRE